MEIVSESLKGLKFPIPVTWPSSEIPTRIFPPDVFANAITSLRNLSCRFFRDKHGMILGGYEESKYKEYELTLAPGDAVFVYTDGVPEANNAEGEFYGLKRMEAALNQAAKETPQGILAAVKADVEKFVNGATQFDDLTMLCIEYNGRQDTEEKKEETDG